MMVGNTNVINIKEKSLSMKLQKEKSRKKFPKFEEMKKFQDIVCKFTFMQLMTKVIHYYYDDEL